MVKLLFDVNPEFWMNGLYLHASSVLHPMGALVFLGHSTSGKSTISGMLSSDFPLIADDVVHAFRGQDGHWCISDGASRNKRISALKRHCGSKMQLNEYRAPLAAVFRLRKSADPFAEPIEPLELCRHLMDAAFEVDIQRKLEDAWIRKQCFSHAADIARRIPGWMLHFNLKPNTMVLIEETINPVGKTMPREFCGG